MMQLAHQQPPVAYKTHRRRRRAVLAACSKTIKSFNLQKYLAQGGHEAYRKRLEQVLKLLADGVLTVPTTGEATDFRSLSLADSRRKLLHMRRNCSASEGGRLMALHLLLQLQARSSSWTRWAFCSESQCRLCLSGASEVPSQP